MTVDEYRDFLLAVVNAHDRSAREGLRKRFVRLYRGWFPDDMKGEGAEEALRVLLLAYLPRQMWFFKDAPIVENPKTEFALHVAILRDKLKSVWIARGEVETAKFRLEGLKQDVRDYRRGKKGGHEVWRKRTLDALEWLGEDLSRLLTCANPMCKQETRLFFRQHNNDRYCCNECSISAQQQKRMERKAAPSKPFTRSDDARLKMSESAKRRWRIEGKKTASPKNAKSTKKKAALSPKAAVSPKKAKSAKKRF
jgi:hypothetical protein